MKKILLISHDASRTGAPILLLNLAKALEPAYEIHFLLKHEGVLREKFEQIAPTFIAFQPVKSGGISKLRSKLFSNRLKPELKKLNWKSYDLIISNTITNGDLLPEVRHFFQGVIISYIHELEMATKFFTSESNLKTLLAYSTAFFAPSKAVEDHLVNNLGVSKEKISQLPYYIPVTKNNEYLTGSKKDNFTVGAIGTIDWRKSPDIFLSIAVSVFKKRPSASIEFKWKGANEGIELDRLNYDIKKSNLAGKVSFTESSGDVNKFYSKLDVFLLTSREDPYPLVVLEAANNKIPTICFSGAGGAPEFITASKSGKALPFLDIDSMANQILFYYDNQEICIAEGSSSKLYLSETHQNKTFITTKFKEALNVLLNISDQQN